MSTEDGEVTAASWKWYSVSDEALGSRPSITHHPTLLPQETEELILEMEEREAEREIEAVEREERRWREMMEREERRERERREQEERQEREAKDREERRDREMREREERRDKGERGEISSAIRAHGKKIKNINIKLHFLSIYLC